MRRLTLILASAALVASACATSSDDAPTLPPGESAPVSTATPAGTASGAAQAGACEVDDDQSQKDGIADGPVGLLADIRFDDAPHPGTSDNCPRVVFEFEDQLPSFKVSYQQPPFHECGSGAEVDPAMWGASAYLFVIFDPASAFDASGPGRETYAGPNEVAIDGRILKFLRSVCDFEAQMHWIIALDSKRDFDVFRLRSPDRIVIDVSEAD